MSNLHRFLNDLRRKQQAIGDLTRNSTFDRIMRDAERFQTLYEQLTRPSELERLKRDMVRLHAAQEQFAPPMNLEPMTRVRSQIASAINAASITSQHFESAAARFAGDAQRISQILVTTGPALRSSMLHFEDLGESGGVLGINSTLARSIESLRHAMENSSPDETRVFLEEFEQGISEALDEAPENPMLRLSWLGHLLSILLFVLNTLHAEHLHQLSSENSTESESRIMQQFRILNDSIDELQPIGEEKGLYQYYMADRQAPLKEKPRPKSTVLRWIQPGELVWVHARKGRWIQIEYVDSLDGTTHRGWVRKKHLTR